MTDPKSSDGSSVQLLLAETDLPDPRFRGASVQLLLAETELGLFVCPECGRGHFGAHGLDPQPCDNCQAKFARAVGMST